MEFKMKIINDLNNNSDLLSVSKKEDEDTSLLGSLFSIDFNSSEVKLNDISDDIEFVLQKEDLEIISFLSDIFPNLNISNLDVADFKKVKNKINFRRKKLKNMIQIMRPRNIF